MVRRDRRRYLIEKWENNQNNFITVERYNNIYLVRVPYGSSEDINQIIITKRMKQLIEEVIELINTFVKTLSPFSPEQIFNLVKFDLLDNNSLVISMNIKPERFPLVIGRKYNNIYALKRFVSNISGKYKYYYKFDNTIALIDPIKG